MPSSLAAAPRLPLAIKVEKKPKSAGLIFFDIVEFKLTIY